MKRRIAGDPRARTLVFTGFALIAFATNSVLCRMALWESAIDPAGFTAVRLASGAVTLLLVSAVFRGKPGSMPGGSWASGAALFIYAAAFSFAYVSLSAGTGALILFGAVQATMILFALWSGERLRAQGWIGLVLALAGLVYLVSPGLEAPSAAGSALMAAAGISWGIYSLRGRNGADPLAATTGNFVRTLPLVAGLSVLALQKSTLSTKGILLAAASGSAASGLGYVVWYFALRGLAATQAATVQLAVPVLAALGGVIFLSEDISMRLLLSAIMILSGIRLAAGKRTRERT
jgi:drug/metabolite transporter (DMT)-like permease